MLYDKDVIMLGSLKQHLDRRSHVLFDAAVEGAAAAAGVAPRRRK